MPSVEREKELNDRLWERVRPLLPVRDPSPRGGRPRADDRACFEAIVFMLRNGLRWRDLPKSFPSPATCWRRHAEWTGDGVWEVRLDGRGSLPAHTVLTVERHWREPERLTCSALRPTTAAEYVVR